MAEGLYKTETDYYDSLGEDLPFMIKPSLLSCSMNSFREQLIGLPDRLGTVYLSCPVNPFLEFSDSWRDNANITWHGKTTEQR